MATQTRKSIFNRPEKAYVHPYFGGVVLGIVLFLAFLEVIGRIQVEEVEARAYGDLFQCVSPKDVMKELLSPGDAVPLQLYPVGFYRVSLSD